MIAVRPYGDRFFAVYEDKALLAVCAYRKGALAVQERIEGLLTRIAQLEHQHEASRSTDPGHDSPEDVPWSA